jgi:hypothetical protein
MGSRLRRDEPAGRSRGGSSRGGARRRAGRCAVAASRLRPNPNRLAEQIDALLPTQCGQCLFGVSAYAEAIANGSQTSIAARLAARLRCAHWRNCSTPRPVDPAYGITKALVAWMTKAPHRLCMQPAWLFVDAIVAHRFTGGDSDVNAGCGVPAPCRSLHRTATGPGTACDISIAPLDMPGRYISAGLILTPTSGRHWTLIARRARARVASCR